MANLIATQAKKQQTYAVYFDSDEPHLVRFPTSTSSSTSTFSPASSYTSLHATSQSSTSTTPSTPGQLHTGFVSREHSSQCKILPAQDVDTESPFVNLGQLSLGMRQPHGLCSTATGTKSGGVCNNTLHQRAADRCTVEPRSKMPCVRSRTSSQYAFKASNSATASVLASAPAAELAPLKDSVSNTLCSPETSLSNH